MDIMLIIEARSRDDAWSHPRAAQRDLSRAAPRDLLRAAPRDRYPGNRSRAHDIPLLTAGPSPK